MAIDFALTDTLQTEYNERGDIRAVRADAQQRQSIAIGVIERVQLARPSYDATRIEELRSRIAEVVRAHPETEPPIAVSVVDRDTEAGTLTFGIETARVSLTLESETTA